MCEHLQLYQDKQETAKTTFYSIQEILALTGYKRRRFNELLVRLEKRTTRQEPGKEVRLYRTQDKTHLANPYANWLLYERFLAPQATTRPKGFVTLKWASGQGLTNALLHNLIVHSDVHALVWKGRYYLHKAAIQSALNSLPKAPPSTMVPLVHLQNVTTASRQALHKWVKRRTCAHKYLHPKRRSQEALYISAYDAYKYLTQHFNSSYKALSRLRVLGERFFRCVARATGLSMSSAPDEHAKSSTLSLTFTCSNEQNNPVVKEKSAPFIATKANRASTRHVLLSL